MIKKFLIYYSIILILGLMIIGCAKEMDRINPLNPSSDSGHAGPGSTNGPPPPPPPPPPGTNNKIIQGTVSLGGAPFQGAKVMVYTDYRFRDFTFTECSWSTVSGAGGSYSVVVPQEINTVYIHCGKDYNSDNLMSGGDLLSKFIPGSMDLDIPLAINYHDMGLRYCHQFQVNVIYYNIPLDPSQFRIRSIKNKIPSLSSFGGSTSMSANGFPPHYNSLWSGYFFTPVPSFSLQYVAFQDLNNNRDLDVNEVYGTNSYKTLTWVQGNQASSSVVFDPVVIQYTK